MTGSRAPSRADVEAFFAAHGGTADDYLREHWPRFAATHDLVVTATPALASARILDVGAHWLHQAAVFALSGHEVHALDVSETFGLAQVRSAAEALGITLLANESLETLVALEAVPDDHYDIVLFTEVIEHLAFNPVPMWREIHRTLRCAGRIFVTTPNYYALRGRFWSPLRCVRGYGGGLRPEEILGLRTRAHHWKEFSRRELEEYFRILSPDFECRQVRYLQQPDEYRTGRRARRVARRVARVVERWLPGLRPHLYMEVELTSKQQGITARPRW